jgi:tetratricopeptide (TPR) repeat protein
MGNKQKAMEMFGDVAKNGTNPNIRRLALYNRAQMFFDAKQYEEALGAAAGAVSEVSRTPNVEVERAVLYLKAKAGFAVAATKQGGEADKIRAEAEKAATTLASAGGRYGPMAQELLITAGGGGGSGAASFQALASADKLNEQQKWSEAAAAYEAFLAGKPAGASKSLLADAQLKMGLCYYRLKAYAKSADAFKAVMDLSGDPSRAARAGYYMAATRGLAAMESGKEEDRAAYLDALTVLEKRYPTHEEIDNIEFRLGAALEAARKYAEAAQKYRKVREGAKDYREAQLRAGICDTILLAESWQKKAPESETKPLLASAVKSLKAADAPVSEGDAVGQKVAADAAVRLARIYMSGGVMKPEEALSALKDYEKKYPEQVGGLGDALFLRFWAYEKLGKLEEALNTLREAVAKEPQNPQIPPAFETLAVDCDDAAQKSTGPKAQELRENAIALLDSYLTQFGPSAGQEAYERLLMRRARLSAQAGKWDKAVADYAILYERHKDALNINKELANAYSQQGNYAKSLELYQSLEDGTERYTPDWWQARYNVALMFYKMNDMDRMVRVIMSVFIFREDLGGPEVKKKFDELILKSIEQMKGYQETAKGAQLYSPQWWQAVYDMALGFNKAGDQGKMNSLIDGLRILQSDLGGANLKKKFDALQGLAEKR